MTDHTPVHLGWRAIACTLIEKTDGAIEQPERDIRRQKSVTRDRSSAV
jgi:hypothetical protein